MSGIYWSLTALSLLVSAEDADKRMNLASGDLRSSTEDQKPSIIDFVFKCFDKKSGGFGGNKMQDGHILYTL
jgi:prenyltransferase beta subunit